MTCVGAMRSPDGHSTNHYLNRKTCGIVFDASGSTRDKWDWPIVCKVGEPQPFPHLADGFRFPRLGETIKVQISAIESAEVSFDQ